MPEEGAIQTDLEKVLGHLEDYTLNEHNYQALQNALNSLDHISASLAEKLLSICVLDKIEDLKYTAHIINILSTFLKKIKDGCCTSLPNLVPSALAVLNVLKTTALFNKVKALKTLCFEIIIIYPDVTLISLVENHSNEIFELINLYCHDLIPAENRLQPLNIVATLLRILPPDKKAIFVKDGIKVWFSIVIPTAVKQSKANNTSSNMLDALELLTDELVHFDYSNNHEWRNILENIHTPKRYPAIMKGLLENGSHYWHRLWIMFIKLLKSQITICTNTTASPINSLLPCVETAFKMDVRNRCRAFLCWNVLIDNFSKETNEAFLNKRLKLLVIPLTSNNAKVEETALAKFNTWWHLITRFQTKMDKFLEMFVIPFLHFCFGKPTTNTLIPGKISAKTKVKCVQAFINIVGHTNCDGCVTLPKLDVTLLNTKLLVNHWKDWIHSLSNAIKICVEHHGEFTDDEIKCVWKTFVLTIGELPENNIRRDLFNEALFMLGGLTQNCDRRLTGTIVNVLIPTLFDRNNKLQMLLKSKDEQNSPVSKIITVLNKMPLEDIEDRKTAIQSLKLLTDYLVEDAVKTSSYKIEWFVNALPSNGNGLFLWTVIAESIAAFVYSICPRMLSKMFLWPFKMYSFVNREESTSAWINMYKIISPYLEMKSINKDILKALLIQVDNQSSRIFILTASIVVLEQKLNKEENDLHKEIELILQLTSKISDADLVLLLPSLSSVIVHILKYLDKNSNTAIAGLVMVVINNILKSCNYLCKQHLNAKSDFLEHLTNIFNSLESSFKLTSYSHLKSLLVDQLKECAPHIKHEQTLRDHILEIYKIASNNHTEHIAAEIMQAFEIGDDCNSKSKPSKQKEGPFATPSTKNIKNSKKEAHIIDTVVENGEKFEVVESNWKFNPRKLTDNQKEKLQRKREDIPALYQDLSQSQDEFKLNTWKTDSQDTSTTSSKSSNAAVDVTVILKNLPHSEIVPKIIENVIAKPTVGLSEEKRNFKNNQSENTDKLNNVQVPISDTKSPRMALKDRVFRNVRNLIEKSNLNHELNDADCKNVLKTPLGIKVKPSDIQSNSAPGQIISDRPSRVKRKPKKFDDLQMFSLKKKRYSTNTHDSQADFEVVESHININADSTLEDTIDIENKEKTKEVDSQELMNISIENSAVIKDDDIKNLKPPVSNEITEEKNNSNNKGPLLPENNNTKHGGVLLSETQVSEEVTEKSCLEQSECSSTDVHPDREANEIIQDITSFQNNKISDESLMTFDVSKLEENNDNSLNTTLFKSKETDIKETEEKIIAPETTDDKNTPQSKQNDKTDDNCRTLSEHEEAVSDLLNKSTTNKITIVADEKSCVNDTIMNVHEKIEDTPLAIESQTNATPKADKLPDVPKSSNKKPGKKRLRIENQLAIDMVEGHPFLKVQSEKRLTRKTLNNSQSKRKSLTVNENRSVMKRKSANKADNKTDNAEKSISIKDSQNTEDMSASQDFIESSQDSNVTTLSVKSTKPFGLKKPVVVLKNLDSNELKAESSLKTIPFSIDLTNIDSDTELPYNKTHVTELTENMDTEPINYNPILLTDHIVVLSDEDDIPMTSEVMVEQNTQNTAEASTQPVDPEMFSNKNITEKTDTHEGQNVPTGKETPEVNNCEDQDAIAIVNCSAINDSLSGTAENITKTMTDSVLIDIEKDNASSPCDNEQRKKDFLNNTMEISPIKTMSPMRDQTSPTPETSSDYVVIKLTSPVQINGEPLEKFESPEVFTEDKVSPDKRDQSPPREEVNVTDTSPSSSLSLKKNRPQVRPGGRAAQMLGLCVPDRLQQIMPTEKTTDNEESKKSPSLNSTARRNLRILYNSSNVENNDTSNESENSDNFLKFKRTLPTTDCSPSGPILKRKLVDITDETTASPASKRKRVSFHDPPVSTTICVKKYIEPLSIRSPQNSASKRLERQTRAQTATKSPRRLENAFKLDSVLTKAVESFSELDTQTNTEDTEISSLDETPIVEVIKTSDLNDTDPICIELVDCKDHISNIACQLSSPAMKDLLVEKFEGKVATIGDLAKMTELEVNRLCIKAPKVQVARKVLNEYLGLLKSANEEITPTVENAMSESIPAESKPSVEVQTDCKLVQSNEMQTDCIPVSLGSSQTDTVSTLQSSAQTNESGYTSTSDVITTCMEERPDFVQRLCEHMDEQSKEKIVDNLSFDTITMLLMKRLNATNYKDFLIAVLNKQNEFNTNDQNGEKYMSSILQDHLIEKFESKDLILFCSNLLKKVYDKPA